MYIEALERRILQRKLERVRLSSPFLLRTVTPPIQELEGRSVQNLRRIGKRIAVGFEQDCWLVLHLMIAGRLHWRDNSSRDAGSEVKKLAPRKELAAFDFDSGSLALTEAGSKKRASLHVAQGAEALRDLDPGGLEVLEASLDEFAARLTFENHTLKRALTDPHLLSGIGNAYSDEILHAARLSPAALTGRLNGEGDRAPLQNLPRHAPGMDRQAARRSTRRFPREGDGVSQRHGSARPLRPALPARCGAKVQRIRYADNETNYCATCQTGGKLLADRSLSRLLKRDWPRTLEKSLNR